MYLFAQQSFHLHGKKIVCRIRKNVDLDAVQIIFGNRRGRIIGRHCFANGLHLGGVANAVKSWPHYIRICRIPVGIHRCKIRVNTLRIFGRYTKPPVVFVKHHRGGIVYVHIILAEIPQRIRRIDGRTVGYIRAVGVRGAGADVAEHIGRSHAGQATGTIGVFVPVSAINGKTIVSKAQQRRVLGAVYGVQPVGKVQVAHVGNHRQIQVERRRVLMVVVVAHGRVAFGAIEPNAFGHHGVAVPHIVAHATERPAFERLRRVLPRHAVSVIKQGHTVDEHPYVAPGGIGWIARILHRILWYFKIAGLRGSQRRIAV